MLVMRFDELNAPQRQAVTTLRGPLLVLAGAGTGKTRVITVRIANLISHRVAPERILAVTFTNKAAREMRERTKALLSPGKAKRGEPTPEISTFHSLCVRILRRNIQTLGYPREFSIFDRGDQESLARQALREIRVDDKTLRPGDLLNQISHWKSLAVRPRDAEVLAQEDERGQLALASSAYARYQAALKAQGAVDFDDLLLLTEELFEQYPLVRIDEAGRFDHLLIDEYQDTNALQYRIAKRLAEPHRNLCVVGDDDQSIYGWRGAEVTHILSFARDWPDATVVKLEDNYRCRAPILALANTLIAHNSTRHDKTLRAARADGDEPRFLRFDDENAEAASITHEIEFMLARPLEPKIRPNDIAILLRTNEQTRAFELELRRRKLPYLLVGGMSFYDRREIKDLLSYLRVLANPSDEVSLLRILNTPPRGLGPSSVERLVQSAVSAGKPLGLVLRQAADDPLLASGVRERVLSFASFLEQQRARLQSELVSSVARELMTTINYRAELERQYKEATEVEARMTALGELFDSMVSYENRATSPTLLGFLEECTLAGRDDLDTDNDKKGPAITLMTLHSAKGLEFPHVFLVGMEEGLLPHHRTIIDGGGAGIEEERRLAYVGVTRARETLTLSYAKGRTKWGKLRTSIPSRFLLEMKGETERAQKAGELARAQFVRPDGEIPATASRGGASSAAKRETKVPKRASTVPQSMRASSASSRSSSRRSASGKESPETTEEAPVDALTARLLQRINK